MTYKITKEQIEKAKEMDLLTYLQIYEPNNLRHLGQGTYCTRDHDSLKISNGLWHWFSKNIGGKNALDYLIRVRGLSFVEAVQFLTDGTVIPDCFQPVFSSESKPELRLPNMSSELKHVRPYLVGRGISDEVIDRCRELGILREGVKYHNCVFLGYDGDKVRFAATRETNGSFKQDLRGSNKRFSFCMTPDNPTFTVHVFESAIDAMSYATLEQMQGHDWKNDTLLSLSGVYAFGEKQEIPPALKSYLERNPATGTIVCHLDNDEVGRAATRLIVSRLSDRYRVIDCPAKSGKDYNDYLLDEIRKEKLRKERVR